MEKLKEEIMYCTSCGAVNKKSGVFCEECKKKIVVKHRPIVDFLKKRVKGKIAGEITESLFGLLKKYIYSHLYGLVLTVSVVATATVAATNATPYIKTVGEVPFGEEVVKEEETGGAFEITERDIMWLQHITTSYDAVIDNSKRSGDPYWVDDGEYASATELWAENNIEGYAYRGTHELYDNPLPMGEDEDADADVAEGLFIWHARYTPSEGVRTGDNVKSQLGHTLNAEGYDVMEVDYYCLTYDNYPEIREKFDVNLLPPEGAYEKYVYTFLLTRKHGEDMWYIAEERLTEKVGGPRFVG